MKTFEETLKENIEKEGLNFDVAMNVYNNYFKHIRDIIRSETHRHDLYETQLSINLPLIGMMLTKKRNNDKPRQKKLRNEQLI
jgi:hypothetical protein